MRQVLSVLESFRHPVGVVTKGGLIMRDADILGRMGQLGVARAAVSMTTLDNRLSRSMEPRASTPSLRLKAIQTLADAGCPTGVMVAPIIPAINDHEIEKILKAAADAGASFASTVVLRLPHEVRELFVEWLESTMPDRRKRVMNQLRELHGGKLSNLEFGNRMTGRGELADLIAKRFRMACQCLGLKTKMAPAKTDLFRVPPQHRLRQAELPFI